MGSAESYVEKYLVARVKELGGEALKVVYQGRTGAPDRWCILPGGRIIIVETKSATGKLSTKQRKEIQWFRRMGFEAHVVSSREMVDEIFGIDEGPEHEWKTVSP